MLSITCQSYKNGDNYHIAWGDFSIGEYWTKSFASLETMQKFILTVNPAEIIFDMDFTEKDSITAPFQNYLNCLISIYDVPVDPDKFITSTCQIQSMSSYGQALDEGRLHAFALLLNYIKHTQKTTINNITRVALHSQEELVLLDDITIKNLEIFTSSYELNEKYSLIGILDTTQTA